MDDTEEPTFTLRARDAGAADALAGYIQLAADRGAERAHVAELRNLHQAFSVFPVRVTPGREPYGSIPGSSVAFTVEGQNTTAPAQGDDHE